MDLQRLELLHLGERSLNLGDYPAVHKSTRAHGVVEELAVGPIGGARDLVANLEVRALTRIQRLLCSPPAPVKTVERVSERSPNAVFCTMRMRDQPSFLSA